MNFPEVFNLKAVVYVGSLLLLASCATMDEEPVPQTQDRTFEEASRFTLVNDKVSDDVAVATNPNSNREFIRGTGEFINLKDNSLKTHSRDENGNIDLNFLETDVRAVIDAVLREMLLIEYILDPTVNGQITLQSNRSLDRYSVLLALEEALRIINIAMVPEDGVYHIMPLREAPRRISAIRKPTPSSANLPGFGVEAISLDYITPTEMQKVLEPFAPEGSILNIDNTRNLMILAGTAGELANLQELINTFDVDWLKGMSFALFSLENVDAQTIQGELETVFSDASTPIAGMVKFVPMSRLNSLLVISNSNEYLEKVGEWIERFDRGGQAKGRKIYVYSITSGKAENIANSLNQIYGGQLGGGTSSTSGTSQNLTVSTANSFASGSGGLDQLKIVPNIEDNSLLILATPEEYNVIENALKQIDTLPRQVLIEATLAEVTLNDDLRYGVNWFFESGSNEVTFSSSSSGGAPSVFPGFSYVYSDGDSKGAVLNTLSSITDVNVISSPKLMVLNNYTGELQVGDQVPVIVRSAQGVANENAPVVNTVEFRDTGVIMNITPHISKGGTIILEIEQEVSEVAETSSSGIDSPTIQQRKLKSTVSVRDGETIALGGLIRENQTFNNSGLPVLKDIPLLGAAFSTTTNVTRRTELIILLTPRVINDVIEMRENMESLKQEFKNLTPFPDSFLKNEANIKN